MEDFYVEINLRKTKWLLCCAYNPSKSNIDFHLEHLNRNLALYYRDYKYFENCRFRADLLSELSKENIEENEEGLSDFLNMCKRILDLHVPRKQKHARGNHMLFMNRALSKEIMTRTRLRSNFLEDRSEENKRNYSKQRNYCVSLLRKLKSEYFGNLNEKKSAITEHFGKPLNPFYRIR